MGETAKEKNEASTEVEKKEENHAKNEEITKDKKKKKKDKNVEGEEDKEGGEKKEKKKKKKNPEDKNDPAKLKLKLEKLDAKMQALAIKKEEILNTMKGAEKNGASGVSATKDASKDDATKLIE